MRLITLALLLCALGAFGQSTGKTTPKKTRELAPHKENVYSDSWESGEIKDCTTFSGKPYLLVCDDSKRAWPGSLINLVGANARGGMPKDEAYDKALSTALANSKTFMVKFSDDKGRDPEPWPQPETGLKMTAWECTKDAMISCSMIGREQ